MPQSTTPYLTGLRQMRSRNKVVCSTFRLTTDTAQIKLREVCRINRSFQDPLLTLAARWITWVGLYFSKMAFVDSMSLRSPSLLLRKTYSSFSWACGRKGRGKTTAIIVTAMYKKQNHTSRRCVRAPPRRRSASNLFARAVLGEGRWEGVLTTRHMPSGKHGAG